MSGVRRQKMVEIVKPLLEKGSEFVFEGARQQRIALLDELLD